MITHKPETLIAYDKEQSSAQDFLSPTLEKEAANSRALSDWQKRLMPWMIVSLPY